MESWEIALQVDDSSSRGHANARKIVYFRLDPVMLAPLKGR